MTRLKENDLTSSMGAWKAYDKKIKKIIGCDLIELAFHALDIPKNTPNLIDKQKIGIIPISSGEGIIQGFSELLAENISFLGLTPCILSADSKGFQEASQLSLPYIIWADDDTYLAENLLNNRKAENGWATGLAYGAALDKMSQQYNKNNNVLVLGAGPVGLSAAYFLTSHNYNVILCDIDLKKAESYAQHLAHCTAITPTMVENFAPFENIVDATPADTTFIQKYLTQSPCISTPCVPCHWEKNNLYTNRLWHDPLQLGTTIMLIAVIYGIEKTSIFE